MSFKPFLHQIETIKFIKEKKSCGIFSTPGCGKTLSVIEGTRGNEGKILVLAPKSIVHAAWGGDLDKFFPDIPYVVATAANRAKAFETKGAKFYITNFDAAKWIVQNLDLTDFDTLILDESTYVKNPNAIRSKMTLQISKQMTNKIIMTGTPSPNIVTDLWHQMMIVDGGERLGDNFYGFQHSTCSSEKVGASVHALKWTAKPGATEAVADMIDDIVIRHELEKVIDMPMTIERRVKFELEPHVRKVYNKLKEDSLYEMMNVPVVTAVHAAALQTKILQICSGSVYTDAGKTMKLSATRYELIMDLVEENEHPTIVGCVWTHQVEKLEELARKRNIKSLSITGKTSDLDRKLAIDAVQAGTTQVLFANIAALSHGVTLTGASRCIFASPVYNSEQFIQFKARIFRAGQKKRTETILIEAEDTLESKVYSVLQGKIDKQTTLTDMLKE